MKREDFDIDTEEEHAGVKELTRKALRERKEKEGVREGARRKGKGKEGRDENREQERGEGGRRRGKRKENGGGREIGEGIGEEGKWKQEKKWEGKGKG